ncbi:MAG TPA: T9SS type A sorting domain-containing protein, partial [Bacteroidia bacterium]|nr:T9SS type A sorting domain-containing protein [Bacteroidia bacterium]
IYMAQLDTSGNWLSAEKLQFNGGSYNIPQCITSDSNNNIYLGGGFEGSIIVNGNTTTYVGGYSDAFLTKYGYVCTVGLDESLTANSGKLFLYPNPVSDYLNVNVDGMEGVVTVMLYNIMGQVVQSQQLQLQQQSQIVLPVQGIPSGVYSLVVSDNKHQLTGRVVIERL